jgi:hypothetical protein
MLDSIGAARALHLCAPAAVVTPRLPRRTRQPRYISSPVVKARF